jgi:hypothetical protein
MQQSGPNWDPGSPQRNAARVSASLQVDSPMTIGDSAQ